MASGIEKLFDEGFADHAFTERDLIRVLGGTPASRYAIVNKALKKGMLMRLRRGLYFLTPKYHTSKPSQFYAASLMVPYSYISLETALAYHQWIPEKVVSIMSVTANGRPRSFEAPIGQFVYYIIAVQPYEFLNGVTRKEVNEKPFFIASPLRALADFVYIRKIDWQGLAYLQEGLRIESEQLHSLKKASFVALKKTYHSKRVLNFLNNLQKELGK